MAMPIGGDVTRDRSACSDGINWKWTEHGPNNTIWRLTRTQRFDLIEVMLQIRTQQLAAFRSVYLTAFVDEMADHMRRVLPDKVRELDKTDTLVASLDRRIRAALALAITDRFDLLRYLECSYVLDWNDDGPDDAARAVLSRDGLGLEAKLDLLEQRTVPC